MENRKGSWQPSPLIKDLPKDLQELCFANQIAQGNKAKDSAKLSNSKSSGNFTWDSSLEGRLFWILVNDGYYPKNYNPEITHEIFN